MRNFKIRIIAGLTLISFILIIGFYVSFSIVSQGAQTKDRMVRVEMERMVDITRLLALNANIVGDQRAYLLTGDRRYLAKQDKDREEFEKIELGLKGVVTSESRELIVRADVKRKELIALQTEISAARERGERLDDSVIAAFMTTIVPVSQALEEALIDLVNIKSGHLEAKKGEALEATVTMKHWMLITTGIALVLSLLVATYYSRELITLHQQISKSNSDLREREESLREAIEARDEMVGVISHELKNPLTAMSTGLTLLRKMLKQNSTAEKMTPVVARIQPSITRMSRLITDLLDITKIEAKKLQVIPGSVDFAKIITEAVHMYDAQAEAKGIELKVEVASDVGEVICDKERIGEVLSNLLQNAMKFTSRGGKVVVGAKPTDGHVQAWVSDTGKGIESDYLPHVFERFWQSKDTAYQGTGLGLAITKGLVEAHGGRVWAESEIEKGSTFFFTLPT